MTPEGKAVIRAIEIWTIMKDDFDEACAAHDKAREAFQNVEDCDTAANRMNEARERMHISEVSYVNAKNAYLQPPEEERVSMTPEDKAIQAIGANALAWEEWERCCEAEATASEAGDARSYFACKIATDAALERHHTARQKYEDSIAVIENLALARGSA